MLLRQIEELIGSRPLYELENVSEDFLIYLYNTINKKIEETRIKSYNDGFDFGYDYESFI